MYFGFRGPFSKLVQKGIRRNDTMGAPLDTYQCVSFCGNHRKSPLGWLSHFGKSIMSALLAGVKPLLEGPFSPSFQGKSLLVML